MAGSISTAFSPSFANVKWRVMISWQAGQLLLVEEGGGAAAPVELGEGAPVGQVPRHQRDLLLEDVEVRVRAGAIVRRHHVAPAEAAHLVAEREVDVDGERSLGRVGAGEVRGNLVRAECVDHSVAVG